LKAKRIAIRRVTGTRTDKSYRSTLVIPIIQQWMTLEVHAVVQDAADFDDARFEYPIQQEMTAGATAPSHMQHAETRHDVIAALGSAMVRPSRELTDCERYRPPIEPGLPRTEILLGPTKNIREIAFCGGTEADAPFLLRHVASAGSNHFVGPEMTFSPSSLR
jgi:hypothetical protein